MKGIRSAIYKHHGVPRKSEQEIFNTIVGPHTATTLRYIEVRWTTELRAIVLVAENWRNIINALQIMQQKKLFDPAENN